MNWHSQAKIEYKNFQEGFLKATIETLYDRRFFDRNVEKDDASKGSLTFEKNSKKAKN